MVAEPQTAKEEFCVYLGPSIVGVIQRGCVYPGSKADALKVAALAVEKYPLIARLIVTNENLAESRIKIRTPGNLLNEAYRQLTRKH